MITEPVEGSKIEKRNESGSEKKHEPVVVEDKTKQSTFQQTETNNDQHAMLESLKVDLKTSDLDWKQTLKVHELQEEAAIKGRNRIKIFLVKLKNLFCQ